MMVAERGQIPPHPIPRKKRQNIRDPTILGPEALVWGLKKEMAYDKKEDDDSND